LLPSDGPGAQGLFYGRTVDTTPVEIALQDKDETTRFKIPKVYLTFSENWKGGPQDFIRLETIFPSMAPLSAHRTSARGTDVLIISLRSYANTGGNYNIQRTLSRLLAAEWVFVNRLVEPSGVGFGKYVYKRDEMKQKNENVMIHEYLVPEDNASADVYFQCIREKNNPEVGCIAFFAFGKNLSLEIVFRRSELQKWQEIRRASINLLESFRVESGNYGDTLLFPYLPEPNAALRVRIRAFRPSGPGGPHRAAEPCFQTSEKRRRAERAADRFGGADCGESAGVASVAMRLANRPAVRSISGATDHGQSRARRTRPARTRLSATYCAARSQCTGGGFRRVPAPIHPHRNPFKSS